MPKRTPPPAGRPTGSPLVAAPNRPIWIDSVSIPADDIDASLAAAIMAAGDAPAAGDGQSDSVPKFRMRAYSGGRMQPRVHCGGYTGGLSTVIDLGSLRVARGGAGLPILYSHDRADPIGHATDVTVSATSIDAAGILSVPGDSRDKVAGAARNGFRWAVSVGCEAEELEYISSSDTVTVNGSRLKGPLYVARKSTLREISILPIGADPSASATVSAAALESSDTHPTPEQSAMPPELRAYITAAGFDADEIAANETQLQHFTAQHAASIAAAAAADAGNAGDDDAPNTGGARIDATGDGGGGNPADDLVADLRARATAERRRIARIAEICAGHENPTITTGGQTQPLELVAIEAGWDEQRTELEALRAARPSGPAIHSTGRSRTHTIEAVTAGLMMRLGVDVESQHYRGRAAIEAGLPAWITAGVDDEAFQRTAEAGHQFRHGHIMEILATCAEIETGRRPHGNRAILEAAFSTTSITTLFGATVGARSMAGFREVADTTASWTTRGTVPDFEEHGRHGIEGLESLDYLPPSGQATHAKRAAWKEVQSAARYAKQFAIDEQDLIGDRLGLLQRTPFLMGQAAARLIPDLVYGLLLSPPTMARTGRAAFHATDGNLGSAAAFSGTALSTAIAGMARQKDGDATLNLMPTHLITGTELADKVVQTIGSGFISNDAGAGSINPLNRYGIRPIADARVSNGVVHPRTKSLQAGSTTAWFLVSTQGETIEVVTVAGTGAVPVVTVTNMRGMGKFGVQTEVKYDVGASFLENRTFYKNPGA